MVAFRGVSFGEPFSHRSTEDQARRAGKEAGPTLLEGLETAICDATRQDMPLQALRIELHVVFKGVGA